MSMDFISGFKKDLDKMGIDEGASLPPSYWFSTGNYVLNRIISGSFLKGIPQGRCIGLVGPAGSGKSFVLGNIIRNAQNAGAFTVLVDSENAFDDGFAQAIGIDTEKDYMYIPVITIPDVTRVVSKFIKQYKDSGCEDAVVIGIDSLDMLLTETEEEQFEKGVIKGDQGQKNKQLKKMLRTFVQGIKNTNISIVVTDQVYRNQDVMNGEGVWMVKDAVKYSLSQIVMLTKLKLKDKTKGDVSGIRMKCEGYKTRFTKPFQTVTIHVPYEDGMDPYSGLCEVAEGMGVIQKKGSRWQVVGEDVSWFEKDVADHAEAILLKCETKAKAFVSVGVDAEEEIEPQTSGKKRRAAKYGLLEEGDE